MAGQTWEPGAGAGTGTAGTGRAGACPGPGRVLAGVRLRELVGRGGTGQVWAGTDVGDGSRVAVKLLDGPPAVVDGALAEGLHHPHLLAVRRVHHDPRRR